VATDVSQAAVALEIRQKVLIQDQAVAAATEIQPRAAAVLLES
jgi:hypothetical protein